VDVDQAGNDDLAARIDRVGGLGLEIRFDGGDAAGSDRDVANGVESERGVDDAAAANNQVETRG
jgi:hypothetical protein